MLKRITVVLVVAALALVPGLSAATTARDSPSSGARATLAYTEHGVPHIEARNFTDLGYGYGFAEAKDNLCTLAEVYLTVRGDRSRYLGASGPADTSLANADTNLSSDTYFRYLSATGAVRRSLAAGAPAGPRPEVRQLVHGFAQGYNKYLAGGRVTDPACKGKPWLRPISDLDVYTHAYALAVVTGSGAAAEGMIGAAPPSGAVESAVPSAGKLVAAARARAAEHDLGSNAIAAGSGGTKPGVRSALLGNPHYPWRGPRRFWQAQLTIPGKFNASGASLLGMPIVMIGHNAEVAWSHTVSTATTFGLFQNPTVPGDPTSYLVDGKPEKMTTTRISVPLAGGAPVTKTIYGTRYGPVITSGPSGVPLPWSGNVFSLRDANQGNLRLLNTWFGLDTARSTDGVRGTLAGTQGVPWVNTLAVDRRGRALFADIQAAPGVTEEYVDRCGTAMGKQTYRAAGLSIVDGSRGDCSWRTDPDSAAPGLLGPSRQPQRDRADFVTNSNDSAWLANPAQPITGYPRTMGSIGTAPSLRTQQGILSAQRRLSGVDGLPGKGFDAASMRSILFSDASRAAELAAEDTARMCAAFPGGIAPSSTGPADVAPYCGALSTWDGRFTVHSKGSLLFQRFVQGLGGVRDLWKVPFDLRDPVHTPNSLNTANPEVQKAFGTAVAELRAAGIAPDAGLGQYQAVPRNGETIPIHGAPHQTGVLNVITPVWDPRRGNTEVTSGSSFIQSIQFTAAGPSGSTLLTYAQSADPGSPHFSDQTRLFSAGRWVPDRFTRSQILASPALRVIALR
ncbi:penicillin acylase family protein [Sciscionella sediminilitoris]|uniref:penicillin acylase family protein n=1 Tax=Sciscionella sediminilitoris TaxID=1445613 RepID=UPI0004DF0C2E|nr:penicillin acylase family protein [Sciscionella sp. SE31]